MNYTPINIKTHYSLLSSMIKIDDLIEFAKKNNLTSLAIADDNMFGAMEFYKKCISNNIKPIIGLELKLAEYKFFVYAKNYNGYKNLLNLSTNYSENNININTLKKYSSDLICILPFLSLKLFNELKDLYITIYKSYKSNLEKNELDGNIIYANEILYLEKKDVFYYKYLLAIRDKKNIEEINISDDNYLNLNIIDSNNFDFTNKCNLVIEFNKNLLPHFICPNNISSKDYLRQLCKEGLIRIFGTTIKKAYLDRIKYELDVINKMGFDDYFLIVSDYVNYARTNNIIVGPGRGSAAGSLVSYALNITTVDPLKYDLLFERFLNPERISMPDIDMDFDALKRDEIIKYCINKYGNKKVAPIITFSTLKSRQVIKDTFKVSNIDSKKTDYLCNMLDRNLSLMENYKNIKIKNFIDSDDDIKLTYKVALKLEDLKRQVSIHAAGVVMSDESLLEHIPLYFHENMYITGYSMDYLEELGLLKMDFLSISFLTLISNLLEDIKTYYKEELIFDNIPLDDKETISLFKKGNTIGIFQFESSGMINFLKKLKPNNFEDLVSAIALYRPGPMQNIDTFIKRHDLKEKVSYIVPELEAILKNTFGIIVYQEQIMQIAVLLSGYTYGQADLLRKAMSKKKEDILIKEKSHFINGCIKNNITESKATEIYELILKFASYGFNRSHSVSYAMISFRLAYLKAHYPKVFMMNLLTRAINSSEKTKDYIYECKRESVLVLNPDINKSSDTYIIEEEGIRYPLSNIKNVGSITAKTIISERNKGPFKDIFDFAKRLYGKVINKKVFESLIDSSAFDIFNLNKKTLHENLDSIINYSELGDILSEELKPVIIKTEEYKKEELLERELNVFGFYLTNHPVSSYISESVVKLKDIPLYFDKNINLIIYVEKIKEVVTKKGEKMLFLTGSDETNSADFIIFPKTLEKFKMNLKDIIEVFGHVEKRFDKYQIIVNEIKYLDNNK